MLSLERSGDVAHLVLDRPPRNPMDTLFFETLARLAGHELPLLAGKVAGLIVRGRGRHFSSGADLAELRSRLVAAGAGRSFLALRRFLLRNIKSMHALNGLPFPVVAAVRGCCLGSGLELALACHARLAAAGAMLALPEAQFGLMPGCGGTVRLPRLVGAGRAVELMLTGRALSAEEALALGVVDRVVEQSCLMEEAELAVRRLARRAWPAVRALQGHKEEGGAEHSP